MFSVISFTALTHNAITEPKKLVAERNRSARSDVSLVPPVIEDFSFDDKLQEGMRTRIYCNIAQGDQPIKIKFLKDKKPIEENDYVGLSVQEVDEFSISFAIVNLSEQHNGNYTCVAT